MPHNNIAFKICFILNSSLRTSSAFGPSYKITKTHKQNYGDGWMDEKMYENKKTNKASTVKIKIDII